MIWSESDIAFLRLSWPYKSNHEIGEKVGRSAKSVSRKGRRLGLRRGRVGTWTVAEITKLTRLRDNGHTAKEIGIIMGYSRNAIIGQLGRSNIKPNEKVRVRKRRVAVKPKNVVRLVKKKKKPPVVARMHLPRPETEPVTILARKGSECAYIVGHHLCCGAPVFRIADPRGGLRASSWCEYHYAIVYRRKDAA